MYPLKFHIIDKPKVWGSERWLISGYGDDVSVVENGYLAGNDLNDLLETYMDELVGGNIYQLYGDMFPLLIKWIDAKDDLSIQVHPDDMAAAELEQSGKTEMWYVTRSNNGSVIAGWANDTDENSVRQALSRNTLLDNLQLVDVKPNDVIFIPAGEVHSLRHGTQVIEIQQSCDITYRLFDYNRLGQDGKPRELHIDEALTVMDYNHNEQPLTPYQCNLNQAANLVQDEHFITNKICFNRTIGRDYAALDSFVIYVAIEGTCEVRWENQPKEEQLIIHPNEAVLIPASLDDIQLIPTGEVALLETYIV